jgi:NH3-dependent NAD+ synthetase
MIDKLLENEIDKEVLSNECAVLLSGGVDSMSVGFAAERVGRYGISKSAILHYKHTKDTFDKFRNHYFSKNMRAGYKWHKRVADMYDKIFVTPYLTKSVRDYFYSMDWEEVNKPKQKHHVRNAYPQFQNIKVKDHLNLQLDSDIDKLFETLLDDKEINFKNRSRILDISKDWNKTGVSSLKEFL